MIPDIALNSLSCLPLCEQVYMIQEFMERGPLLEEGYNVEPIPENEAVFKFIQV